MTGLGYFAIFIVLLAFVYLAIRLGSAAYYRSKREFVEVMSKFKEKKDGISVQGEK